MKLFSIIQGLRSPPKIYLENTLEQNIQVRTKSIQDDDPRVIRSGVRNIIAKFTLDEQNT